MKLLAIDTSTEAMALAVCSGQQEWLHLGEGGAKTSAHLLPQVQALLQERMFLAQGWSVALRVGREKRRPKKFFFWASSKGSSAGRGAGVCGKREKASPPTLVRMSSL